VCHNRKRYTSDLSDAQWDKVRPMLPIEKHGPGRRIEIDRREAVNAMLYVAKTGCQWENLPGEFPNYNSVFYHYRKWCVDGTWEQVNRALVYEARRSNGACPIRVRQLSIARASKPPGLAVCVAMMQARKLRDVNATLRLIPWGICSKSSCILQTSRTAMGQGSCCWL
jgi:transposase